MTRQFQPAPRYSDDELDRQRLVALDRFIQERQEEGDANYLKAFADARPSVERLFGSTNYLRDLRGEILAEEPSLLECARFLTAPPISEDDLDTLVGQNVAKRKTLPKDLAEKALSILVAIIDRIRCPWIGQNREPTRAELKTAIDWTTGLLVIEQLRTDRRTESARRQQDAVANMLRANGWMEGPRKAIYVPDDLPRGSFCQETDVSGAKCDIPIRMHDGRLLALECKVSNSGTNSVKRLMRETCGKAGAWKVAYGQQILTGAVLAGVFKLKNLIEAQNDHEVVIFWEHDLQPLVEFVNACQ